MGSSLVSPPARHFGGAWVQFPRTTSYMQGRTYLARKMDPCFCSYLFPFHPHATPLPLALPSTYMYVHVPSKTTAFLFLLREMPGRLGATRLNPKQQERQDALNQLGRSVLLLYAAVSLQLAVERDNSTDYITKAIIFRESDLKLSHPLDPTTIKKLYVRDAAIAAKAMELQDQDERNDVTVPFTAQAADSISPFIWKNRNRWPWVN